MLIQLSSSKEINEILKVADDASSPFALLERWMEVIGAAPQLVLSGLSFLEFLCRLGEGGFRLLGDCLG